VPRHPDLSDRNNRIFDEIRENGIEHVILVARWEAYHQMPHTLITLENPALKGKKAYEEAFRRTVSVLSSMGVKTWIMRQLPHQKKDPPNLSSKCLAVPGKSERKRNQSGGNRAKVFVCQPSD
jgi:hypothetical protein